MGFIPCSLIVMINIAIIEDEKKEQEFLLESFKKLMIEKKIDISLQTYKSGEEFLFEFEYNKFDIVLMDIDLGKDRMNGLTISKKMREIDSDVILIFITNLAQYAIDGYTVNAYDYIIKPFSFYDFSLKINTIINNGLSDKSKKIVIKCEGKQIILPIQQIFYIEVVNHTLIYYTSKGDYSSNGSLSELSKTLAASHFSLCNSCYLINLRYVESISGFFVMVHGKQLTISHPRKKKFITDLNEYLGL